MSTFTHIYRIPTKRERLARWMKLNLTGNAHQMGPKEWVAGICVFLIGPAVLVGAIVIHWAMEGRP